MANHYRHHHCGHLSDGSNKAAWERRKCIDPYRELKTPQGMPGIDKEMAPAWEASGGIRA